MWEVKDPLLAPGEFDEDERYANVPPSAGGYPYPAPFRGGQGGGNAPSLVGGISGGQLYGAGGKGGQGQRAYPPAPGGGY